MQTGGSNASGAGGSAGIAGQGGMVLGGAGGFVAECGQLAPASSLQRYSLRDLHESARRAIGPNDTGFALKEDSRPSQFRGADHDFVLDWVLVAKAYANLFALRGVAPTPEDFIKNYGRQLYRRELTAEQVASYLELFEYKRLRSPPEQDEFEFAARVVLFTMLVSPYFLFRVELGEPSGGPPYRLSAHEVAARLSHFVLESAPDPELLLSAADGSLLDPRTLEAQYERLRSSQQGSLTHVWRVLELLGVDRLQPCIPWSTCEPNDNGGDNLLTSDMFEQTKLFVSGVLERPGATLNDLLVSVQQPLNLRLAQHYGVDATTSATFEPVLLDASLFPGVLTHGSVLTSFRTPTQRGVFVLDRLLRMAPPPPSPGHLFQMSMFAGQSPREKMLNATREASCRGCHDLMDPIGFAFDAFDEHGRLSGFDSKGELRVPGEAPVPVASPGELSRALAGSRALKLGVARSYYEQLTDRQLASTSSAEQAWLECMVDHLPPGELDLHTLARTIASSDAVRLTDQPPRQAVGVATDHNEFLRAAQEAAGLLRGLPQGRDRELLEQFIEGCSVVPHN